MKHFTNRLLEILEKKSLSASQFAEKIGVQRSSVSHILSGRNKPSLDFIIKITSVFNDISLEWLINGKKTNDFSVEENESTSPTPITKSVVSSELLEKELKEIVFFYKDNSYKIFKN
jgi:transcriptional regulator with XRE-family HTH domain